MFSTPKTKNTTPTGTNETVPHFPLQHWTTPCFVLTHIATAQDRFSCTRAAASGYVRYAGNFTALWPAPWAMAGAARGVAGAQRVWVGAVRTWTTHVRRLAGERRGKRRERGLAHVGSIAIEGSCSQFNSLAIDPALCLCLQGAAASKRQRLTCGRRCRGGGGRGGGTRGGQTLPLRAGAGRRGGAVDRERACLREDGQNTTEGDLRGR